MKKHAETTHKATTTNQAYLSRLPEARALEAAYNRGELSAVEYNSLADIAFFEIPDGLKEVDDDAEDYSNMDYIGHSLEEPRPQFHGCGMIARRVSICHR